MYDAEKLKLLNAILARGSANADNVCCYAARGIEQAVRGSVGVSEDLDIDSFAKAVLSLYDSSAEVEVLNFSHGHFDTLFAFSTIGTAVKRLSGFSRSILVVYGLDSTLKSPAGRVSQKRRRDYFGNVDFIEDYVLRYRNFSPTLEIIFV